VGDRVKRHIRCSGRGSKRVLPEYRSEALVPEPGSAVVYVVMVFERWLRMEMFRWLFDFAFPCQSAFPHKRCALREGDAE
jgi:hypothetical protein